MTDEAIATFAQSFRGPIIGRNHPEYEEARKLYNAMIDKRPLLIARCADVGDVMAAVSFGRENKLPIAIRGGGVLTTSADSPAAAPTPAARILAPEKPRRVRS